MRFQAARAIRHRHIRAAEWGRTHRAFPLAEVPHTGMCSIDAVASRLSESNPTTYALRGGFKLSRGVQGVAHVLLARVFAPVKSKAVRICC